MMAVVSSNDNDTFYSYTNDTLQIMAESKQQNPILRIPVESYKKKNS